jgi:hypothetical protein
VKSSVWRWSITTPDRGARGAHCDQQRNSLCALAEERAPRACEITRSRLLKPCARPSWPTADADDELLAPYAGEHGDTSSQVPGRRLPTAAHLTISAPPSASSLTTRVRCPAPLRMHRPSKILGRSPSSPNLRAP